MNIFYLDSNPYIAPTMMVDKHVVKMVLETAQLLSTAHRLLDNIQPSDEADKYLYKATHINHPCAVWVRENNENYRWLLHHLVGLSSEYTYRYGKRHKSSLLYGWLVFPPENIKIGEFTQPPSCMDKQYIISDDPITNYRNYYKYGKSYIHKWTKRDVPEWIL